MPQLDDKPATILPLSARNAETAAIALKEMYKKLYEGLDTIAKQQKTLTMLIERVGMLEQLVNVQKMQLTGLGPSVV